MTTRLGLSVAICCAIVVIICCAPYVIAQTSSPPLKSPGDTVNDRGPSQKEMEKEIGARNTVLQTILLFVLLGIFAFFVLVGRAVTQPASISVATFAAPRDTVPDEEVSTFIRETTNKLIWMGFNPMLDFTVPELPHKGFFRWMSDGNGDHTVLIVETTPAGAGVSKAMPKVKFIEFQTLLDNGCKINTNNSPLRNPLIPPPTYLITTHKRVSVPRELFEIHLQNVQRMQMEQGGRIKPQKLEDFERELTLEWQELMQYQAQVGLMKLKRDGRSYQGTAKLILNYFVPGLLKKPPIKRQNEPIDPRHFT